MQTSFVKASRAEAFLPRELEVNYESTTGKDVVPAEPSWRVAHQADARRAKPGLTAQKIAQLNAETEMRHGSFDVGASPQLDRELIGAVVRE